MKFQVSILFFFIAFIIVTLIGCSKEKAVTVEPVVKQIKTMYEENIVRVNQIEILQADGEVRTFSNKETIDRWIDQVGELHVTLNPNPEGYNGVLFTVTFFEAENQIFSLTPTSINGASIFTNDKLVDYMYQLWNN